MAAREEDGELWRNLDLIAVNDLESWYSSAPPMWCCVTPPSCHLHGSRQVEPRNSDDGRAPL
eukprot:13066717-Alexandrium_andersonii.AAC.1